MILSVLACPRALDTSGIDTAGARPAAPAAAPTRFKNPRPVTADVEISRPDRILAPPDSRSLDQPHCDVVASQAGTESALARFLDCDGRRCKSLASQIGRRALTELPVGPAMT